MSETREDHVRKFHEAFGIAIDAAPTAAILEMRKTLIAEETRELFDDIDSALALLRDGKKVPAALYANMLKEMADVQVVLSGMSVALKPLKQLDTAFSRVCVSNLSKLGADGKPILREDGKVLKGPNYRAPDLSDLV